MKGGSQAKMVKPAQKRSIEPAKRSCNAGDPCSKTSTPCRGAAAAATVAEMLDSSPEEEEVGREGLVSASASWLALGSGMVSAATAAAANANTPMMRDSVRHPTCLQDYSYISAINERMDAQVNESLSTSSKGPHRQAAIFQLKP